MRVVVHLVLVALVGVTVAGAGCLEPHRGAVPDDVLRRAPVPWTEEVLDGTSDGLFGPRTVETRYRHDPSQEGAPFPGIMQVFSIRRIEPEPREALFAQAQKIVDDAMQREDIAEDQEQRQSGTRTLRSGVETQWFTRSGNVRSEGGLFDDDVGVTILGEVGFDGRARTEFVIIALVQTSRAVDVGCNPLLPDCNDISRERDQTTWRSVAGDPEGTIGHESDLGLAWNLVTHG